MPDKTPPIGRCNKCQKPAEIDGLNMPCGCSAGGFICSTATPDELPCPACNGAGRSLIRPKNGDDCPVCHGSGFLPKRANESTLAAAADELVAVDRALKIAERGEWPPQPADVYVSSNGSVGVLRRGRAGYVLERLKEVIADQAERVARATNRSPRQI